MVENMLRAGNFTSSEIGALTSLAKNGVDFGDPAWTYIDETNMERRLCRSLDKEENAKPLSWGKLIEKRVFDMLPTEYKLSSQESFVHPIYNFWTGSPDGHRFRPKKIVFDIKCPITLKSFCHFADAKNAKQIREHRGKKHKDGEKYYWQLVSNAILTDCDEAELIVYVPYKSELDAIRVMAQNHDGDQNSIAWINWANDAALPYILDGGYYKNINIISFEIPQEDKDTLTSAVQKASTYLIPRK